MSLIGKVCFLQDRTPADCTRLVGVDCFWNVMALAQKPDFVFRRNGRVHLNRRGRQFSRLLAAEVCASAVVMLDTSCSEVVWRVLATHSIRQFPLYFPSRASPCVIRFQLDSTSATFSGTSGEAAAQSRHWSLLQCPAWNRDTPFCDQRVLGDHHARRNLETLSEKGKTTRECTQCVAQNKSSKVKPNVSQDIETRYSVFRTWRRSYRQVINNKQCA